MPAKKRPDPIYQRGDYRLYARADRGNLEIVWYDKGAKRERSRSAGTRDVPTAKEALDRAYLEAEGRGFCPTCGQPMQTGERNPLVSMAITDYLVLNEDKPELAYRLAHVSQYIFSHCQEIRCDQIDEAWVSKFRRHLLAKPIISPTGKERQRAPGTAENSIIGLAAAIRAKTGRVHFRAQQVSEVNRTPMHRADIKQLAAMFRYAMEPKKKRDNLLAFLRISVATWCRPDAAHDFSTEPRRRQWLRQIPAIALNPDGRKQTRKYRPTVPAARQIVPIIDATDGPLVKVLSVRSAWDAMAIELRLPTDGEAGQKLIRRSVSHLARRIIGEEHWRQGEIMLGHHKTSISDLYALPSIENLGRALAATEQIIDQIEALAPGAFTAGLPQSKPALSIVNGGKNG
ncbi:MAG: hypothetical protein ACTHNA_14395 [Sphingopyxis terrae]|uniref:hypothetical protein n=1 Tax=Sphingopyxis terrae TaxID=33052 RepID=UPI003F7D7261